MDSERFRHATELRQTGREGEALKEFEAMAEIEADERVRNDLIGNQVNCLWRLGRLTEARERLAEAVKAAATPGGELLDAYLCRAEGKPSEAEQKLIVFLQAHRDLKESEHGYIYFCAQRELGDLLFNSGRYKEASAHLGDALVFAEGVERRYISFQLGYCYTMMEEWGVAIDKLIDSLPDDPHDPWWPETQLYLGICHARIGKLELAEQELNSSMVSGRPSSQLARAQYELGCIFYRRGEYLKAKKELEISQFFVDDAALEKSVAVWLAATRVRLGERPEPVA